MHEVLFHKENKAELMDDDSWKNRVESKLDALTKAFTDLVAVQRDVHHMEERVNRLEMRADAMSERLSRVSENEVTSSTSSAAFEKFAIAVAGGAVTVAVALATGLFG